MVASSVWEGAALWFDVSLLITTTGAVRLGCVPLLCCTVSWCMTRRPGCYMSHMSARGSTEFMKASVDEGVQDTAWFLLHRVIHRYKPRLKKGEGGSFPARQAGEFGIVCSRQWGRKGNKQIKVERFSFGKIWFYGVRTHYGGSILLTTPSFPVYRAHLKNLFFRFISLNSTSSSSTITCWISRCIKSPDASSVKRKLTNACRSSWKFSGHACIRCN